jgi:hypothetical protein
MRRGHAVLVILALLASPLALLARGMAGETGECNRMCCLRHGSHSGAGPHAADLSSSDGMMCHRGTAVHSCECAMSSGQSSLDYGFLAPIVPTTPSTIVSILNPEISREYLARFIEVIPSGFLSALFEPPRF